MWLVPNKAKFDKIKFVASARQPGIGNPPAAAFSEGSNAEIANTADYISAEDIEYNRASRVWEADSHGVIRGPGGRPGPRSTDGLTSATSPRGGGLTSAAGDVCTVVGEHRTHDGNRTTESPGRMSDVIDVRQVRGQPGSGMRHLPQERPGESGLVQRTAKHRDAAGKAGGAIRIIADAERVRDMAGRWLVNTDQAVDHAVKNFGDRLAGAFDIGPNPAFAGIADLGRAERYAGDPLADAYTLMADRPKGGFNNRDQRLTPPRRPKISRGTRNEIDQDTPRDAQGRRIDPNTGKVIKKPDVGHKPQFEWHKFRDEARQRGLTQGQVNRLAQDPRAYHFEDPQENRSHRHEDKTAANKWFDGARKNNDGSISKNGLRISRDGTVYNESTGDEVNPRDLGRKWKGSQPTSKQRQATAAQIKADEAKERAKNAWFGHAEKERKARELQGKADTAKRDAKKGGFFSW